MRERDTQSQRRKSPSGLFNKGEVRDEEREASTGEPIFSRQNVCLVSNVENTINLPECSLDQHICLNGYQRTD